MIDLTFNPLYALDLHDDVFCNYDLTLYQFLGKDPVRAFYLGMYMKQWFKELDQERQYLYSKQLRHNHEDITKYQKQIQFWSERFSDDEEIDMFEFAEYLLNNMFWEEKTEETDKVKLALFLGSKIENPPKLSEK